MLWLMLRDLVMIFLICLIYVIFALCGLGFEPFLLALALASAGLPLYVLMRLRK